MGNNSLKRFKRDLLEQLKYETVYLNFEQILEMRGFSKETLKAFNQIKKEVQVNLVELDKAALFSNPYLSRIKIPRVTKGKYTLGNKRIVPKGMVIRFKEQRRRIEDGSLAEENTYCCFDSNLRFPALAEEGKKTCWMSVEPFEIETFKPFIEGASGHVLLCGLGLGYVAYMLSLKEDVKSITVVEISQDVIDIFNEAILPQFENKDKITIVQGDALEFMDKTDLTGFDHVNVDIWRETLDMMDLYLKCLPIERRNPSVKFSYWLEDGLKEVVQSSVIASLVGFDVDFSYTRTIADDITKGVDIKTVEEFIDFVRMDDFRNIMLSWHLEHGDVSLSKNTFNDFLNAHKIMTMEPIKSKSYNPFDK